MIKLKSPLQWYGGKARIADWIVNELPLHSSYCEPFGGGASVLFAKPPCKNEIYNDLNKAVVNFFRVLRNEEKVNRLVELLELTPYSREEFNNCLAYLNSEDAKNDIEYARAFFSVNAQSFSGQNTSWSMQYDDTRYTMKTNLFINTIDRLKILAKRMKKVQIENTEAINLIKKINYDNSLLYIDPPYIIEKTDKQETAYKYVVDYAELIKVMLESKAMIVLSGYKNDYFNDLDKKGWKYKSLPVLKLASNPKSTNDKKIKATELLYFNPLAWQNKEQLTLFD